MIQCPSPQYTSLVDLTIFFLGIVRRPASRPATPPACHCANNCPDDHCPAYRCPELQTSGMDCVRGVWTVCVDWGRLSAVTSAWNRNILQFTITRKHSLLEGKLTQHDGNVFIKLKVVMTCRLPRYGSIIIHIVTVQF